MDIREMTQQECTTMLKSARLGRLACVRDNRPYVVPIHFAFGDNFIFSFSLPGKKVEWMRENPHVCLQVDDVGTVHGWKSVEPHGKYVGLWAALGGRVDFEWGRWLSSRPSRPSSTCRRRTCSSPTRQPGPWR